MKAKKNYDKSRVFKMAWFILRTNNENLTWSDCLKQAWNVEKNGCKQMTFENIYNEYYSYVYNIVNQKVSFRTIDCEEITQDIFIKINKSLFQYNVYKGNFKTWLYKIIHSCVSDYYRSNKSTYNPDTIHVDNYVNEHGDATFQYVDTELTSDESIESDETILTVQKAMQNLNENERQIATLFFIKELKYREISETLDIPMGTVKGLINRVRTKLQNQLSTIYAPQN